PRAVALCPRPQRSTPRNRDGRAHHSYSRPRPRSCVRGSERAPPLSLTPPRRPSRYHRPMRLVAVAIVGLAACEWGGGPDSDVVHLRVCETASEVEHEHVALLRARAFRRQHHHTNQPDGRRPALSPQPTGRLGPPPPFPPGAPARGLRPPGAPRAPPPLPSPP